jgi:hypothetical protein
MVAHMPGLTLKAGSGTANPEPPSRLRLRTLVWLRWVAVAGQTTAVLVVSQGLGFATPLAACLMVVAVSAWVNVALTLSARSDRQTPPGKRRRRSPSTFSS